jgi:hypothetical protein
MFLQVFYPKSRIANYSRHFSNPLIGDGIIGYREQKQESQAMASVTPATRSASFYHSDHDLSLSEDYQRFLAKYPKSILVAFGTTW